MILEHEEKYESNSVRFTSSPTSLRHNQPLFPNPKQPPLPKPKQPTFPNPKQQPRKPAPLLQSLHRSIPSSSVCALACTYPAVTLFEHRNQVQPFFPKSHPLPTTLTSCSKNLWTGFVKRRVKPGKNSSGSWSVLSLRRKRHLMKRPMPLTAPPPGKRLRRPPPPPPPPPPR